MTRRVLTLLLAIAVAGGALAAPGTPRTARAQQPPSIQAVAAFDPPSASIGDRVTLTLRVTHPDDVILKAAAPSLDQVDIVSTQPSRTATLPGGAHATTFEYTLQPFLLGTIDTGTIRLSWLRADGATGTLDVPGAQLIVAPVRPPDDQALRPLKPQASVLGAPPSWVRPAIGVAAALALAVLAIIGARFVRARAGNAPSVAAPADLSPERIARDALDALGAQSGSGQIDYPAYYGGIAITVRSYLAARFRFNAHALTTRELERRMVSHGVDRWQARLVAGLLERCDDAVYAHRHPDFASADHDLTVAYEIVELSRPGAAGGGQAALA